MNINTLEKNGVLVLEFNGKLDTSTAPQAEEETKKYIKEGQKLIINLAKTLFVSSAGLRVFLATAKRLMAVGGALRICGANEVVYEVLEISGFTTILDVKPNLEKALEGF